MRTDKLFHRFIRSRPHLLVAVAVGVAIGLLLPADWDPVRRALLAWNGTAWFFLVSMAWVVLRADHRRVKEIAGQQDENAGLILLIFTLASVLSMTAIVVELRDFASVAESERILRVAFTALTLFGSWFLLGTLFCIHYAHYYYQSPHDQRPLGFPHCEDEPDYWDFLYFSFTIAVAVQTSDVTVNTRQARKLVLAQSVLSFFFNLVILGLSVNLGAALINNG
jgi:uncharacterized membrane protein